MPRIPRGRRGDAPLAGKRLESPDDIEDYLRNFWKMIEYDPNIYQPDVFRVEKLDLEIKTNRVAHHTEQYDISDAEAYNDIEMLVVRRGQRFDMTIKFSRPYDETKDDLRLIFEFGKCPLISKGSRVEFILSDKDLPNEWGAWITRKDGNCLSVAVTTPPTCAVAKWTLKIDVVEKKETETANYRYKHKDPIYVIFNPWCKEDQVYLEKDKDEYVVNDTGKIYRGSRKYVSGKPWDFGQYSESVLPCAMYLLEEKSSLTDISRGDAVKVTRQLSSLINGFDNNGVLAGNWSGDYAGGTSPLAWNGSAEILTEYYKTKETVNFGQCWVFSGVLTTVCRALGIPARSVTNFASAHDTDASCTIDIHTDSNGDVNEFKSPDSVWNFHVWNEVWMRRDDLPQEFCGSGWQVIDATPQEKSDGIYCMGPFPTEAIKHGVVYLPYDGRFAFAEVNADKVVWRTDENGKTKVIRILKNSVGKRISTKVPNSEYREDITNQYKFSEGSPEERSAVRRATLQTKKHVYDNIEGDVSFEIDFNDETLVGDPIKVKLKITNTSSNTRTVSGTFNVCSAYYTGEIHTSIRKEALKNIVLKAKEEKCFSLESTVDDYYDKLVDNLGLKLTCVFQVEETNQVFSDFDERQLLKPGLIIEAPKVGSVKKQFSVKVSFVNKLHIPLTNCELKVDGPGLQKTATFKQKDVPAKGTFTASFELNPVKAGNKEIIVSFNSPQLLAVDGSAFVDISK